MRPIKLTLEGFTSFRSRQVLDFTELDLFALTGPTGAGKSSLLDAITYALYGKVVRKSNIDELVSQGAKELKVEFQFQVKQTKYQVIRTWRYRPSTPEIKFLLDSFNQGQWERCDKYLKIEDILNLDFDTFTRVILLPQGQFDEFLKGNAGKRREMLRSLGGFNIFETMRQEASDRAKRYKDEGEKFKGLLDGLQAPAPVEVTAKKTYLNTLELTLPQLTEKATNTQKILDQEEGLLKQIQRKHKLEQDLAKINTEESKIANIKRCLQQAQVASRLQSDWVRVEDTRQRTTQAEKNLQVATANFEQAEQELARQRQHYDQIQAKASEIESQLKKRGEDIATAKAYIEEVEKAKQEVTQAENTLKQKAEKKSTAEAEFQEAQKVESAIRKQREEINLNLTQISPGGSRLAILNQVIPLLSGWETIAQQTKKAKKKLNETVQELQEVDSQLSSSRIKLQASDSQLQEAKAALKAAEATNAQIAQHNQAIAIRASLNLGDDCPVCGGKYPEVHQLPSLSDAVMIQLEPLQESLKKAQQANQEAQTVITQLETRLTSLREKETESRHEWEEIHLRLAEHQTEITAILGTEAWDVKELKQEQQALSKQDNEYQKALSQQQNLTADLEKLEQRLQFSRKALESAQEESITATEEVKRRQTQLQEIQDKLHQITEGQFYENLEQKLETDRCAWQEQKQVTETKFQEAKRKLIEAETTEKKGKETADLAKNQQEQLETKWQTMLAYESFTETSFQEAQATTDRQKEWEADIGSHQQKKVELSGRIQEITDTVGNRTTDETALAKLRDVKKEADDELQQAYQNKADLETWLKEATRKIEQAKDWSASLDNVKQQEQIYQTLSRDLQTNKFQAYILEHLERELVARATVLLQDLTDSRYVLIIDEGEYCVEDNWNGGEKRRVRTLSGGETFAASLSMALALSEKLSMGVELGSLFLDEGFGTLDGETLEIAREVLVSLGQQDRLIGVITHIPALAEGLPTQVKVHKSSDGSRIEIA